MRQRVSDFRLRDFGACAFAVLNSPEICESHCAAAHIFILSFVGGVPKTCSPLER